MKKEHVCRYFVFWCGLHLYSLVVPVFYTEPLNKAVLIYLVLFKSNREKLILYIKAYVRLWLYLTELFLEWEMLQTTVVEKIQANIYVH
jgi:glutathionyl-hydroquinone reductase